MKERISHRQSICINWMLKRRQKSMYMHCRNGNRKETHKSNHKQYKLELGRQEDLCPFCCQPILAGYSSNLALLCFGQCAVEEWFLARCGEILTGLELVLPSGCLLLVEIILPSNCPFMAPSRPDTAIPLLYIVWSELCFEDHLHQHCQCYG